MILILKLGHGLLAGALGLVASAGAAGPAAPGAAADEAALVIATTSIWADITSSITCDDGIEVRALLPDGADPHSYEPSFADRDALDAADLIVTNGLGLEQRLADTLESSDPGGTRTFVAGDHVEPRRSDEHGDGPFDPHFWLDPTKVADTIAPLGDALVAAGADADLVRRCAEAFVGDLGDLDAEITAALAAIPDDRRILVTNHDALGYFADRYDFEILGSVLPSTSTLAEASQRELDELAQAITDAGVPAIFAENLEVVDDAQVLGDRLRVDVVSLYTDSLGDADSGASTYADMLRTDAAAIADALG